MNYLTNLVARQRDEVETLQPRLPSRFEPQSTALHFELAQSPLTADEPVEEIHEFDVTRMADDIMMSPVAFSQPPRAEPQPVVEDFSQSSEPAPVGNPRPGRLHNIVTQPPAKAAAEASLRKPRRAELGPMSDESTDTETGLSLTVEVDAPQLAQSVPTITDRQTPQTIQPIKESDAEPVRPNASSPRRIEPPVNIADSPDGISLKALSIEPTNIEPINSAPAKRSRNVATRLHSNSGATGAIVEDPGRRTPRQALARVPVEKETTLREPQNRFRFNPSPAPAKTPKRTRVDEEHEWYEAPPPQRSAEADATVEDDKHLSFISRVASQNQSLRSGLPTVVPKTFQPAPLESRAIEQPGDTGPIINVSIGRVEVRATTAPVMTAPKKQHQHVLSLDDYLHQRVSGGKS